MKLNVFNSNAYRKQSLYFDGFFEGILVIIQNELLIFLHIPKCGGTSVSIALDEVALWNDLFVGASEVGEALNRTWGLRFSIRKHSTPNELRKILGDSIYERYVKFVVVRNPVDRFLSSYNFMIRGIQFKEDWIMPSVKAFGLNSFNDINNFIFSDFFHRIEELHGELSTVRFESLEQARVWEGVKLFVPQYLYFDSEEGAAGRFRFFKLEEAAEKFDFFMRELGFVRGVKLNARNVNDHKIVDSKMISNEAMKIIKKIYSKDFSLFSYPSERSRA